MKNRNQYRPATSLSRQRKQIRRDQIIKVLICIVLFIVMTICFWAFMTTAANAMSYHTIFENSYSYSVRNQCREVGRRYGYSHAIECAESVLERQRIRKIDESYVERNQAIADYLRDHTSVNERRPRR